MTGAELELFCQGYQIRMEGFNRMLASRLWPLIAANAKHGRVPWHQVYSEPKYKWEPEKIDKPVPTSAQEARMLAREQRAERENDAFWNSAQGKQLERSLKGDFPTLADLEAET